MAEAVEQPSHAQMIAEMKKAGYVPGDTHPAAAGPSPDQMIKEMQAAGFQPPAQAPGMIESFLNNHPGVNEAVQAGINDLPLIGGIGGAALGGGVGTGLLGPGAGTVMGGTLGAGWGAETGSYAKDALNYMIYGKKKDFMQAHQDSLNAQQDAAMGTLVGETGGVVLGAGATAALATKPGSKVGALISNVSDEVVRTYAAGANRIKEALKSANESTFRMGMAAKEQYGTELMQTRQALGKTVEEGIADSKATMQVAPIVQKLESAKAALSPKLDGPQIQEIDTLIAKAKSMANEDGVLTIQDAHVLKQHLQSVADAGNAYGKAPGLASVGSDVANAAKGAAAVTRQEMVKIAPDPVVKALGQEHKLYVIEDSMNKSLLIPRKSAKGLIDAGSDAAGKNAADLQDMQQITGTNMTGPAQDVAAADAFGKYKFGASVKGLGQPTMKMLIDSASAAAVGQSSLPPTLGQAVMHGTSAQDSLKQVGGGQ